MGWFDKFGHFDYLCELILRILRILDAFGYIWKFPISAEELSQLFWRIHQKYKIRIFANKWVDLISFGILIINMNLFVEFHGSSMHLATFENFEFLQKSSVSSFAGFIKNTKSDYLPINGSISFLGTMINNMDLFVKSHGFLIYLAWFEYFVFLQKSSVCSFAGFITNSKSWYLPINGLISFLGTMINNVDLFVEFHGFWMHLAWFEDFVFLQKT